MLYSYMGIMPASRQAAVSAASCWAASGTRPLEKRAHERAGLWSLGKPPHGPGLHQRRQGCGDPLTRVDSVRLGRFLAPRLDLDQPLTHGQIRHSQVSYSLWQGASTLCAGATATRPYRA